MKGKKRATRATSSIVKLRRRQIRGMMAHYVNRDDLETLILLQSLPQNESRSFLELTLSHRSRGMKEFPFLTMGKSHLRPPISLIYRWARVFPFIFQTFQRSRRCSKLIKMNSSSRVHKRSFIYS